MKHKDKSLKKDLEPVTFSEEPKTCKNCGYADIGKYCSNCGQSFKDIKRPILEVLGDFVGMFNLDSSIFRTVGPFLFKPGFLTGEYLAGRRVKYMSPVRLYLFLSILLFFLARMAGERSVNPNISADSMFIPDSTSLIVAGDTVLSKKAFLDSISFREALARQDSINPPGIKGRFGEKLVNALDDQSSYISQLLNNISYALFLLMPLFALILQLLYIRRNRYYIEHLIFSLNMHSFALLVISLVIGIKLILKDNGHFMNYFLFLIPVYFTIGMRRFYNQGIAKTLLKEIILGLVYMLLLAFTLTGLVFLTLYIM